MKKLQLNQDWLVDLFSKGLGYPTSNLISGPGGTGKPLLGFGIVNDWLKAGGNVMFIPLQYPETKFVKTSLKGLYGIKVEDYQDRLSYVKFDLDVDEWERTSNNELRANLLKPEVWQDVLGEGERFFSSEDGPGTLVFASALNLLLFSPTYKEANLDNLEELLKHDKERTYIFTVSTSAFREDIRRWEHAADTLMFSRMEEGMKLYLRLERLENEKVSSDEVNVPITKERLKAIKEVAEGVRKRKIPAIKKF